MNYFIRCRAIDLIPRYSENMILRDSGLIAIQQCAYIELADYRYSIIFLLGNNFDI